MQRKDSTQRKESKQSQKSVQTRGRNSKTSVNSREDVKEPEKRIIDLIGGFPIRLVLPSNLSFSHTVTPDVTLGDLVSLLRRAGQLISVAGLSTSRGPLNDAPGWIHKSLKECGIGPGDDLTFETEPMQEVQVNVRGPTARDGQTFSLFAKLGQCSLSSILSQLERVHDVSVEESAVVVQFGCYYETETHLRRCFPLVSGDDKTTAHFNEDDGQEAELGGDWFEIVEVLARGSGIRGAPGCLPAITVLTNTKLLCLVEDGGSEFVEAKRDALFDPRYLAFIEFLVMEDRMWWKSKWFIECDKRYGDCQTGKFAGEDENETAMTQKSTPIEDQSWSRCFLLLQNNDLVPKFKIPEGAMAAVFVRDKVALTVAENRIRRQGPNHPVTDNAWTFMRSGHYTGWFSDFELELTAAMRIR